MSYADIIGDRLRRPVQFLYRRDSFSELAASSICVLWTCLLEDTLAEPPEGFGI